MFKLLQYILAYISLLILWGYIVAIILSLFNMINFDRGGPGTTIFITVLFGSIYHKLKPMDFKDLLEKIGISL